MLSRPANFVDGRRVDAASKGTPAQALSNATPNSSPVDGLATDYKLN